MRYFVISPDGSKYGPADIPTLQGWVAQGRIAPHTLLEEESSHQRVEARLVAGLFGIETPAFSSGGYGGGRPEVPRQPQQSNSDAVISFICSALGILCCGLFIIPGFVYAARAIRKANPAGKASMGCAWLVLVLWIVTTIIEIMFFKQLMHFLTSQTGVNIGGDAGGG